MSRKRHRRPADEPPSAEPHPPPEERKPGAAGDAGEPSGERITASGWSASQPKTLRKEFPDPGPCDEPVRIALSAEASAEIAAHAKESLDAEVCGVLVGELCEDGRGLWVSARAAVRGSSARQGTAHVTYTQETWEKIYHVKDRDYPKLEIVGWYHSHPGFGVEFSEMDLFIQRNFFAAPAQFALVVDPLGGDEAVCANGPEGIVHLRHYWVDGRRRSCRMPRAGSSEAEGGGGLAAEVGQRLKAVEDRLCQLLQASEEDRVFRHRVLLTSGILVAFAAVLWIGYTVYRGLRPPIEPPKMIEWMPIPVQMGDKTVLLGVGVYKWDLPPELNAALVELVRQQREAEEAAKENHQPSKETKKP